MHILKGRLSASSVYLIFSGASSLFFALIVTVNLVYQIEVAKLSPLQLVFVGTALETICFLCQVPTGVLADVYSRRLAVILGTFVIGVGFVLEGSIPRFEIIVLGQAPFGIGATLTDGAEQAWIADEVGEEPPATSGATLPSPTAGAGSPGPVPRGGSARHAGQCT